MKFVLPLQIHYKVFHMNIVLWKGSLEMMCGIQSTIISFLPKVLRNFHLCEEKYRSLLVILLLSVFSAMNNVDTVVYT